MFRRLATRRVFRLWNALDFGQNVHLYSHVSPSRQVYYDLLNAGNPNSRYAHFKDGVELWCWPTPGDMLPLEEIRSSSERQGHASAVLRFLIASADFHGATLVHGKVESHYRSRPTGPGRCCAACLGARRVCIRRCGRGVDSAVAPARE